jgi:tetratricopeptide (TPR) repeat protein
MPRSSLRLYARLSHVLAKTKSKFQTLMVLSAVPALATLLLVINPVYADPSPFDHPESSELANARPKLATAKDYFARGTSESTNKNYDDAVADFNEALRLNPNYGEAFGNRGAAKFDLQDFTGALSDYNAALKVFPANQALLNLKSQAEQAINERDNQAARAAQINQIRSQAAIGGDFADPSTMIMRNAQQRGLIPSGGDMSDPATIIMMNAKRRGLIPQDTPNP